MRGNLQTVKEAALLLTHVLEDEVVGAFLSDGAETDTKAKIVRASLVVLERLEAKVPLRSSGGEVQVWKVSRQLRN